MTDEGMKRGTALRLREGRGAKGQTNKGKGEREQRAYSRVKSHHSVTEWRVVVHGEKPAGPTSGISAPRTLVATAGPSAVAGNADRNLLLQRREAARDQAAVPTRFLAQLISKLRLY